MSNEEKLPTGPISLDQVLYHAREKLKLRALMDDFEQQRDDAIDARRLDKKRHEENLETVIKTLTQPEKPKIPFPN